MPDLSIHYIPLNGIALHEFSEIQTSNYVNCERSFSYMMTSRPSIISLPAAFIVQSFSIQGGFFG